MDWRPRAMWALLALLAGIGGALLTRWITHVDRGAHPSVGVAFNESPPFVFDHIRPSLAALEVDRFRVPRVVLTSSGDVLLIVTPATRSIAITGVDPAAVSCGYLERAEQGASAAFWVDVTRGKRPTAIAVKRAAGGSLLLAVPRRLSAALARLPKSQGAIRCVVAHPIAANTTFTERTVTVHAENGVGGAVVLDISALEDIDNLRFSGGLEVPFAGERTRMLDRYDSIVSAEWSSVAAQEERDVVLVTIGALAAIAAAMAIEAVRPFVEREKPK